VFPDQRFRRPNLAVVQPVILRQFNLRLKPELDTQLDLSQQLGFIAADSRSEIDVLLTRIGKMLYVLHELKKPAVRSR
jgi:hypothetical protein